MASVNIVTVSGMFGTGHTYFADSPVVIDISGLQWPASSPYNIVHIEVWHGDTLVGYLRNDTGGQSSTSIDISSALRAMWSDINFSGEVAAAQIAVSAGVEQAVTRAMRAYYLRIYTEYMAGDDGGVPMQTQCAVEIDGVEYTDIPGGQCLIGGLTEWERSLIDNKADADVSHLEHTGVRNGDASTKPISSPERVGRDSITSWVDVENGFTKSIFYPADALPDGDDTAGSAQGWGGHAPIVVRDSQPYTDFLFVNRRGALETCSTPTLEAMDITVDTEQYARVERPSFKPSRSLMAISSGGRRSWVISSGHQTRDWAEWWTTEFLMARQWWMLYKGRYVPVTVKPSKNQVAIYDRTKQQMPHVDFTVTLALEG